MNIKRFNGIGIVAAVIAVAVAGCGKNPENKGVGERTGAALDNAAESTADAARTTGEKVKDVTGQAVEKTGEALESAGGAIENAGDDMQK